jgi:hypothetical protein
MRRTLITGVVLAVAMVATPGAAHAKGNVSAVAMCGPDGCGPPTPPGSAAALAEGVFGLTGGTTVGTQPPLGVYYRMRFLPAGELPDAAAYYVPRTGAICVEQRCVPVSSAVRAGLDAASAGVTGYRPHITAVSVDGARVPNAQAYAHLYDPLAGVEAAPAGVWDSRAITIEVRLTPGSPWSASGVSDLTYYPRYHLLSRDGQWRRVDAALDGRIRAATAPAPEGHGGVAWPIVGAAVAAGAAALGIAIALRRSASRRPRAA